MATTTATKIWINKLTNIYLYFRWTTDLTGLKWKRKHCADSKIRLLYKKIVVAVAAAVVVAIVGTVALHQMYAVSVGVPFCTVHNINDRFLFVTANVEISVVGLKLLTLWYFRLISQYTTEQSPNFNVTSFWFLTIFSLIMFNSNRMSSDHEQSVRSSDFCVFLH